MPRKTVPARYACRQPFQQIYRFRVSLQEVEPLVWRIIEVPETYSFWDFHVAITDAFDWLDTHLHEFVIHDHRIGETLHVGIPDEDMAGVDGVAKVIPGWERKLADLFSPENCDAVYSYDFGDGWEVLTKLDAIQPRETGVDYPRCIAGERAGPPDDCGGPGGYADLLEAIRSPRRKDHRDKLAWLRTMKGPGYDPDAFDPGAVRFDDPEFRRRVAIEGAEMTPDLRCWQFFRQGR